MKTSYWMAIWMVINAIAAFAFDGSRILVAASAFVAGLLVSTALNEAQSQSRERSP